MSDLVVRTRKHLEKESFLNNKKKILKYFNLLCTQIEYSERRAPELDIRALADFLQQEIYWCEIDLKQLKKEKYDAYRTGYSEGRLEALKEVLNHF